MALTVQEEIRNPVNWGTEASVSNPLVQLGSVQSWQEATISVQKRGTDSKQLSKRRGDKIQNSLLSRRVEVATERFKKSVAEQDDPRLLLKD